MLMMDQALHSEFANSHLTLVTICNIGITIIPILLFLLLGKQPSAQRELPQANPTKTQVTEILTLKGPNSDQGPGKDG